MLEEAGHIDRGGRLDNPARIRQLRAGKKGSKAASQILFGQLIKAYGQKLEVGISETIPDLVYTTGATVEELRRMLPALREGGYIEYHAPFAGRSVTVLYPTVEAAELKVDYSVVKERRRRDQERLQRTARHAAELTSSNILAPPIKKIAPTAISANRQLALRFPEL